MTKFEQITESPKALAEFLDKVTEHCVTQQCTSCPIMSKAHDCNVYNILKFLNSEVEE